MKSELNFGVKKEFPKLMKRKGDVIIILFDDEKSGTIVYEESFLFGVGAYVSNWDMNEMEDFYGKITLSN